MTGWSNDTASVVYQYDANGARTNTTRTAGGSPASTAYTFDEDNRLTEAVAGVGDPGAVTNKFAYDYRSRRYYRSASDADHMYCVFDGGLSVQEYTVPQASSLPSPATLTTEFIRGEGMGGGVGGMVYSIADGNIKCSHANHRGDVIARSDSTGSLTSFALYEAYGTRPYEWGSDPDRQKANTKEEETDLNLLNEGMRYRDLETGTFLTRDPIGYADGPNVYCYVHCNPITHFDLLGLLDLVFYNSRANRSDNSRATGADFRAAALLEAKDNDNIRAIDVSSADAMVNSMKEIVASRETIDKITVFEHGNSTGQYIGGKRITTDQYAQVGGLLQTTDGNNPKVVLKGCEVAQGNIQKVADLTLADVTAGKGKQDYTRSMKSPLPGWDGPKIITPTGKNKNLGKEMTKHPRDVITVDDPNLAKASKNRAKIKNKIKSGAELRGSIPKGTKEVTPDMYTEIPPERVKLRDEAAQEDGSD